MAVRDLLLDAWAALGYKRALQQPDRMAPSWVPKDQLRRLASYKTRAAYLVNNGAQTLPEDVSDEVRAAHREYGDVGLLVRRVVAGVLGEDMAIVVDGADAELPDAPKLPDEPPKPGEDASDLDRRVYDSRLRVWQQRAAEAIESWERAWAEQPAQRAHQDWLRGWAEAELLDQRLWEGENQAVGLGDAVYVLGASSEARRPKVRIYDPGFYFPVLDDQAQARGYPTKVHIAYEELDDEGNPEYVRRITWELGPILPQIDADGLPVLTDAGYALNEGDRLIDGQITRRYPWSEEDSAFTCYMTDARWRFADIEDRKADALDESKAIYLTNEDGVPIRRLDLRQDFLPVIHVPNTPASQEHFGTSIIDSVAQLFDDLSETDSDLQKASALAGTPMLGASGPKVPPTVKVSPGAVLNLGADGKLTTVDLSASVEVLRDLVNELLERLYVNIQVPAVAVGRADPARVSSGILYTLSFQPFAQLVGILRLVRDPKYALVLKFAGRMAQAMQILEPGPLPRARLVFGSFLPQDRKAVVEEVVQLLQAKGISRATALRLLVAAGLDVDDISEELDRIRSEDFAGANALAEALADEAAAAEYLGREPTGNPAPPTIPIETP